MASPAPREPERLDASERALLETLLLEAPVAFAFYDLDLRWQRINRALAETNGRPMEDHIGRRPTELLAAPLGAAIEANLRRVIETGEVIVDDDFTAPDPVSGTIRHWQSQWFPASGTDGGVIGVAVMVTDVTERRRAEAALRRSQVRTERLQQATSALGTALTVGDVARVISALGSTAVGADSSGITLLDGGLVQFESVAEEGEAAWASGMEGRPGDIPPVTAEALRSGRPVYVSSPGDLAGRGLPESLQEYLAGTSERAWAALPLTAEGVTFAALRFAWVQDRPIEREEQVFLEALAGQCSLAFERARLYERERHTAEALQRSLLPDVIPDLPGVEIAATYRPGMEEARVGGDWYDAFALPDGRVAVVVGDVMGKGVSAAAGMGRMRSALRALAYTDPSPAAVLTGLDRLFTATEADEQITTLVYAVLDASTGRVVAGDAGHPPVVHVSASGDAVLRDFGGQATPLGIPEERGESELVLNPGDVLVAYSDGLVESRSRGIGEGIGELSEHVARVLTANPGVPVRELVDVTVTAMAEGDGHADDVTVLGIRWLGASTPTVPA